MHCPLDNASNALPPTPNWLTNRSCASLPLPSWELQNHLTHFCTSSGVDKAVGVAGATAQPKPTQRNKEGAAGLRSCAARLMDGEFGKHTCRTNFGSDRRPCCLRCVKQVKPQLKDSHSREESAYQLAVQLSRPSWRHGWSWSRCLLLASCLGLRQSIRNKSMSTTRSKHSGPRYRRTSDFGGWRWSPGLLGLRTGAADGAGVFASSC